VASGRGRLLVRINWVKEEEGSRDSPKFDLGEEGISPSRESRYKREIRPFGFEEVYRGGERGPRLRSISVHSKKEGKSGVEKAQNVIGDDGNAEIINNTTDGGKC